MNCPPLSQHLEQAKGYMKLKCCPALTVSYSSPVLYIHLIKQAVHIQICYGRVCTLKNMTKFCFVHSAITVHIKRLRQKRTKLLTSVFAPGDTTGNLTSSCKRLHVDFIKDVTTARYVVFSGFSSFNSLLYSVLKIGLTLGFNHNP